MKSDIAIIHILTPEAISKTIALKFLTEQERDRACRFHFYQDAIRWASFRAQMRVILGEQLGLDPWEVPLKETIYGKPLVDSPSLSLHFNLSHCADLGLLALTIGGQVGVDIEPLDRAHDLSECENTFCHPNEIAALPDSKTAREIRLLEIWTIKEAALKALGTGLSHPPESVQVSIGESVGSVASDLPLPCVENLKTYVLSHPLLDKYRAVLATTNSLRDIEFHSNIQRIILRANAMQNDQQVDETSIF